MMSTAARVMIPKAVRAMQKTISAALVLLFFFSLTACAGSKNEDGRSETGIEDLLAEELRGEITVSCFNIVHYERFLSEAAARFENAFPGTRINILTFSSMPETTDVDLGGGRIGGVTEQLDRQEESDYISGINAQLIGGRGPDILAMDVLPCHRYADAGLLEDLRVFMDADENFHMNAYRRNIFESTRYKGGQYFLPLDFDFRYVVFDKDKLSAETALVLRSKDKFTYPELIGLIREQFAADGSDARVIDLGGDEARAFRTIWQLDYNKYVDLTDKNVHFTDSGFAGMLLEFDRQRRSGYFQPVFATLAEEVQDSMDNQDLYYFQYQPAYYLKLMFIPTDGGYRRDWPAHPDPDEIAGLLTNEDGGAVFRSFQSYAINANSQNKALAWAFLKFMLSEEMQQSTDLLGLPVNNAAFTDRAGLGLVRMPNYVFGEGDSYTMEGFLENPDEKYIEAYQDYLSRLNVFVDALDEYSVADETISRMITDEAALFFNGSKSAEDVAAVLQNKVRLYLDE